jgi:YbbR domain-containing protein
VAGALRVLLHNWHLKLAALGLAVLLWALVQTEPLSQETFAAVPVTAEVLDSSWTMARPPSPATVDLQLGGPAGEIIRLTVRMTFEPAIARNVHVSVPMRGELPDDIALASVPELTPSTVVIRGPESRMMGLDSVSLAPLDLGSVSQSGSFSLPVDTTGLRGAVVRPASVSVMLRVEPMVERVMENVPVEAEPPAGEPEITVTPSSLQLRLEGPSTLVTAVDVSRLRVSVDPESLRGLQPGEMRRVRIQVEGVPPLVTAFLSSDVATARRAETPPGVE